MSPARRATALGVLTLAVIMLAVDGTVLSLAVPALAADLDPSAGQVLWIGDIYSFALAGLLITMGNLADIVGRKRLLLVGTTAFGFASVVAGLATSPEMLIAARAVLGIAGATVMPSTLAIVRHIYDDPQQRTRAIAIWSTGAVAGAAAGPLVGGLLLQHFPWGTVFLINAPVVVVLVGIGAFVLPESRNSARAPVDLVSSLLSILAIVPGVYAVKHLIGTGFDSSVVAGIVISASAGTIFIRRQHRLTTPLVDLQLFRYPAFSGAVAASGIAIFGFVGLLFFFSQYLQLVRGMTPLQAGLVELPSAVMSIIVITVSTHILRRLGRGPAIAAGLVLAAGGFMLLAIAETMPGLLGLIVALAVVGLGSGLSMTLATDAVVSAVPKARAGAASSIAETAYELGVALGIALLGSLHTALYRANLPPMDKVEEGVAGRVRQSLASASGHLPDPYRGLFVEAQQAFTTAMQWTSLVAAVLLVLASVVAWRVIPRERHTVAVH